MELLFAWYLYCIAYYKECRDDVMYVGGYAQVICKYCTILCSRLQHHRIWVFTVSLRTNLVTSESVIVYYSLFTEGDTLRHRTILNVLSDKASTCFTAETQV